MALPHIIELMLKLAKSDGLCHGHISLYIYNEIDPIEEPMPIILVHSNSNDDRDILIYHCVVLEYILESNINKNVKVRKHNKIQLPDVDSYTRPVTVISCTSAFGTRQSVIASTYYDME